MRCAHRKIPSCPKALQAHCTIPAGSVSQSGAAPRPKHNLPLATMVRRYSAITQTSSASERAPDPRGLSPRRNGMPSDSRAAAVRTQSSAPARTSTQRWNRPGNSIRNQPSGRSRAAPAASAPNRAFNAPASSPANALVYDHVTPPDGSKRRYRRGHAWPRIRRTSTTRKRHPRTAGSCREAHQE